jgi:hypothetical protein
MKPAFISKGSAAYVLFHCFILLSCSKPETPEGQWLANIPYSTITYRMIFESSSSRQRLFNVTFKRYDVPMDTIFFNDDSVYLRFGEFFTAFGGRYDRQNNKIVGTWTTEDSVNIPVTFHPVHADTVSGMFPRRTKEYRYSPPEQEDDQWPVGISGRQQVNQSLIDSLTFAIMKERYPDVHSLLIARNDSLVYEEYFYTFTSAFRQNIQSVTKSFVSALTGIALAKGEIKDVKDPLCIYLSDYQKLLCSEQNKTITLHNALSMSTGLKWDEATYDYGDPRNSLSMRGDDPFGYLFTRERSSTPEFAYNSLNHSTMNAVLKNVTHMDNATEITSRLLAPLGIESFFLGNEEHGVLGDIELRPRDMMKLGQLYLNEGKWNGKEIISRDWVNESTSTKIVAGPDLGYGYFWWTHDFKWKDKTVKSFFAWGYGGQYIFVVPSLKLVVAMTGSHWTTDPKNHVMEMMEKYIIPSCN